MSEENQEETEITNRLNKQLAAPVTKDNATIPLEKTAIGPFLAQTGSYTYEQSEKTPSKPTIIEEIRVINSPEDMDKYADLAHQSGDNIVMPLYQLSEDLANKIKDIHTNHTAEYLNGNPAAQLSAYFHELAHYNREHNQIDHISGANGETNVALNYVDEKSAYVIQNIALVNIYNHCKENNLEYFVYKDTKIKTEELLDMHKNLRGCVEKNGTDLKSDKTLTAIAKTASEVWDEQALPHYENSEFPQHGVEGGYPIVQQIQAVKDGQKAMSEQLKNIDIGYGMKIDLPEECKSFIYPDKQYLHNLLSQNTGGRHASNEGLLAIDTYLEQRGLKNNDEKHEYIKKQYEKIVNRAPDADQTLKQLMLNAELNPANDRRIYYTDGLLQKNIDGISQISEDKGGHFYPINQDKTLLADELKKQQATYPPTSLSPELTAFRSLNNTKMNMAISHTQDQPDNIKTEQIRETSVTQTVVSKQNLKHNTGR